MFPSSVALITSVHPSPIFNETWREMMQNNCHGHPVWKSDFVLALQGRRGLPDQKVFALAKEWSRNMVVGSYCFPRYVAALASRAEQDTVRHGLLENAWDESGGKGHAERSHFWLAVRLAKLLGFSDQEIECTVPIPAAQAYTDEHYQQCSTSEFGFALGMISLIEEFTTPEFTLIRDAFLRTCGVGMDISQEEFAIRGGTYYFDANIEDDERHREEMPQLVAGWLHARGVDLHDPLAVRQGMVGVSAGVKRSADLRLDFFQGIWRGLSL